MIIVGWIVYAALAVATAVLLFTTAVFAVLARGFDTVPQTIRDFQILWGGLLFSWSLVVLLHYLWKRGGQE